MSDEKPGTPLPWFYNSYGAIFSSPAIRTYEEEGTHSCDEPQCRECYTLDPLVASVPVLYGDTAILTHKQDAEYIVVACNAYPSLQTERDTWKAMLDNATEGVEQSIRKLFGDELWDNEVREMAASGNSGFNGVVYGVLSEVHSKLRRVETYETAAIEARGDTRKAERERDRAVALLRASGAPLPEGGEWHLFSCPVHGEDADGDGCWMPVCPEVREFLAKQEKGE